MKKILIISVLFFLAGNCLASEKLSARQEIESLKVQIEQHNKNYYKFDAPTISDYEYDKLFSRLKYLEEKYPQYALKNSPTQKVGAETLKNFKQIKHKYPLYSLNKCNSYEGLKIWDKKNKKDLKTFNIAYDAELKIDGLAVSLIYENGVLKTAATRGNGRIGEDITKNIKYVQGVPQKLSQPLNLQVGGEVYMPFSAFEELNKSNSGSFAHPRNAAAGSLRQLDENVTKERGLKFFAYSVNFENETQPNSQFELLESLKSLGFSVNPETKRLKNIEEAIDYCKTWDLKRFSLEYPIDGVVIKVNDLKLEKKLGYTSHAPKWAIAYKYRPKSAATTLLNIEFQVGKTGIITPVAIFEPVELGGAKVQRASLHNFGEINQLDLRIGDKIAINQSNEIIPQIISVDKSVRTKTSKKFQLPAHCPSCGALLVTESGGKICICPNTDCSAKNIAKLEFFVSRQGMNIKGIGASTCKKLVENGMVKTPADLYGLSTTDLQKIDKMGPKNAQKIYDSVQASKNRPLASFISALCIENVGKEKSKILAEKFGSIEDLAKAQKEDLIKISGINDKISQNIVGYFKTPKNQKELQKFRKYGVIK